MTEPTISVPAPRGRPRSERSHRAIIDATNELLKERGFVDLTIDEVALRAKVSKATIYRRWPSKGTLVFEAFSADFLNRQPLPSGGSLHADLLAALRAWIKVNNGTVTGRTLAGLIAEVQRDPELAVIWRESFVGPVRVHHRAMVDRAIERGEISADVDAEVVLDMLYGPAYHRLLQSHLALSDQFAQAVVDTLVAGVRTNHPGTKPSGADAHA
jgi:AcrR family transcriptional regulator